MEYYTHLTFLILIASSVPPIYGQLFSNEDTPSLLNQFLQVVWEPSSLIRLWVGLDQLYNIALSWRTVAKKIVSLPFGESHSMSHVRLQEPRRAKYYKPSAASQWDRFNKIYASSNLSPVVATGARNRIAFNKYPTNIFQTSKNNAYNPLPFHPNTALYGIPPPLLLQMQGMITNPQIADNIFQNINGINPSLNFGYNNDPNLVYKLLNMQKLENNNNLQNKMHLPQTAGAVPSIFKQQGNQGITVNATPEEKLKMFLKLMKTLGEMHTNDISRKSFETSNR